MFLDAQASARDRAQDLMWDAMDLVGRDNDRVLGLCREALDLYPDCVDALALLANLECDLAKDYVDAMRMAVEAGRRDLGSAYFKEERGYFWGLIETRPFMRAMGQLVQALLEWGTIICIDEAIELQQEMLELNPNDNQGVRYHLVACYLQRKRYDDAASLLKQYEDDSMAVWCWARVLHAHVTGDINGAMSCLVDARGHNPFVELYLSGQKRRPRTRPGYYSFGDDTEAVVCANTLWEAWKKHPKSKQWLKVQVSA